MLEVQDLLLGSLLFQLDRFAGDGDHLAGLVAGRVAGRDHFQAYGGTFRATNQLDHFVQAPADHVDHFITALSDANDLVRRCDLLALLSRAGRHQTHHLDVFVVALQDGADAFQRQAHVDVEVFRIVRRQIGGVRVVGGGEGIDVGLEHVLATGLLEARQLVLVALGQQLLDVLGFLAGDLQAQHFVFDTLAPQFVEFGAVFGPGRFLAIDLQLLVDSEVDLVDALAQLGQRVVQALFHAGQMAAIDGEPWLEVATFQQIIEFAAPLIEFGDVAGSEIAARWIEQLQVVVIDLNRAFVVQRRLVVVMAAQQLHYVEAGDHLLAIRLQIVPTGRCGGLGRQRQGTEAEYEGEGGACKRSLHADST